MGPGGSGTDLMMIMIGVVKLVIFPFFLSWAERIVEFTSLPHPRMGREGGRGGGLADPTGAQPSLTTILRNI